MNRVAPILLAGAVLVSACGIDKADIPIEPPPLATRDFGTTPADSTENQFDPRGRDLVVGFNRAMLDDEITYAHLVPRPFEMGEIQIPGSNRREVLISDVVLDPIYSAYRLVLDGPTMLRPTILSYYSGAWKRLEDGSMRGEIGLSRGNDPAIDVLVYAIVPPGLEDGFPLTGAEEELLGQPIVGITSTATDDGWYKLSGLEIGKLYLVVAILDTNEDGLYDPVEDWWGFYRNAFGQPVEVRAGIVFGSLQEPPLPEMRTDVDFSLKPPGDLDPGFGN